MDTVGVFRPSTLGWHLRNANGTGNADVEVFDGAAGDLPVTGDWNNDGVDTIGVYRPSQQLWLLRNQNTAEQPDVPVFGFGGAGDQAVVGDWDGR